MCFIILEWRSFWAPVHLTWSSEARSLFWWRFCMLAPQTVDRQQATLLCLFYQDSLWIFVAENQFKWFITPSVTLISFKCEIAYRPCSCHYILVIKCINRFVYPCYSLAEILPLLFTVGLFKLLLQRQWGIPHQRSERISVILAYFLKFFVLCWNLVFPIFMYKFMWRDGKIT
jgi:hypothetical protein